MLLWDYSVAKLFQDGLSLSKENIEDAFEDENMISQVWRKQPLRTFCFYFYKTKVLRKKVHNLLLNL